MHDRAEYFKYFRYEPTDPKLLNWVIPCKHTKRKLFNTVRSIWKYYRQLRTILSKMIPSRIKIYGLPTKRDHKRHVGSNKPHECKIYTFLQRRHNYLPAVFGRVEELCQNDATILSDYISNIRNFETVYNLKDLFC